MKFARLRRRAGRCPLRRTAAKMAGLGHPGRPGLRPGRGAPMAARLVRRQRLLSLAGIQGLQNARPRRPLPLPRFTKSAPIATAPASSPNRCFTAPPDSLSPISIGCPSAARSPFIDSLARRMEAAKDLRPVALGAGRSPLAPRLPGGRRPGLPEPGPPHPLALRRRNRARQPDRLPRLPSCQYAVCPGRAERRIASARHRPPGAPGAAIARRRQHRGGRRARGQRHAGRRPDHRVGAGPWRIRRGNCISGDVPRNTAGAQVPDRRLSCRPQAHRSPAAGVRWI